MVVFFFFFKKSSKVILSRVQHHCFPHTLNLKKGSPRLYSLLTLLTALQKRKRWLKLFSFYPKHPKHIAICYSPGTSFLRNINTTFPTGRKECSSPPKRNLLLSHPPRQARKQNTIGAWSAQTQPRGDEPGRGRSFHRPSPSSPNQLRDAEAGGSHRAMPFPLITQIMSNGCRHSQEAREPLHCTYASHRHQTDVYTGWKAIPQPTQGYFENSRLQEERESVTISKGRTLTGG